MKKELLISIFYLAVYALSIIGWVNCIYKAATCNWEPIGKVEVFYTVGALTGAGAIIGWIDIKDN